MRVKYCTLFAATLLVASLFVMQVTAVVAAPKSAPKPAKNPVVKMVTVRGTIMITLYPKYAPLSCANFVKLVNKGFYNGLTFHRIADLGSQNPNDPGQTLGVPGKMKIVQGGSPDGTGGGGPGYTFKGEFNENGVNNPLVHDAGAVAMARTNDPDSAGSQFYICVNPVHFLDGKYAVFGKVTQGLAVADKLKVGDKMTKVTMVK